MGNFENSEMIIGVSELEFHRLMLAIRDDVPHIDHAYIRDGEGQLYLFAHGNKEFGLIINGEPQEPWEHIEDYFCTRSEPEDVKVICCQSAYMEWDDTGFGTKVEPVIETTHVVSQYIHKREDGLYDIKIYENRR